MAKLTVTEKANAEHNLFYLQSSLGELLRQTNTSAAVRQAGGRMVLEFDCDSLYADLIKDELDDKIADIITVNYKYKYFRKHVRPSGLNAIETELLLTGLIAADIEEDKRYATERLKHMNECAIDGIFNFRLRPLKRKWDDIVSYMPSYFINTQLKEFITYLLENKKKRVYVENSAVYDMHYRKLIRGELMDENITDGRIIREILLSNCGEVELSDKLPETDEYYLREFYGDKVYMSKKYN